MMSCLTEARGLKCYRVFQPLSLIQSCLTEARGLKYSKGVKSCGESQSCLTEARGLKSLQCFANSSALTVVPHRGTWIEMRPLSPREESLFVVPHRGTWIEIHNHRRGKTGE